MDAFIYSSTPMPLQWRHVLEAELERRLDGQVEVTGGGGGHGGWNIDLELAQRDVVTLILDVLRLLEVPADTWLEIDGTLPGHDRSRLTWRWT